MEITEFGKMYGTEEQCIAFLKAQKEKTLECPKCHGTQFYWLKGKLMHECKHCHKRIGLRVGTVMHGSKMPFRAWLYAMTMQLLSSRQPSAKSISRYFGDHYGRKRYQPAWEMLHKLRDAMGKHDMKYKLNREVEVDEAFFTSYVPCKDKTGKKLKRGAGSQRKVKVLVMAESLTPEPEKQSIKSLKKKHPFNRALGYVRMRIVSDLKQGTIYRQLCKFVALGSTIYTDASKSHSYFSKHYNHVSQVVKPEDAGTVLPWVHICISNYKRELDDVHHGMKWDYMQYYLDSCSYRFNRRKRSNAVNWDRFCSMLVETRADFRHRPYRTIKNLELSPMDSAA